MKKDSQNVEENAVAENTTVEENAAEDTVADDTAGKATEAKEDAPKTKPDKRAKWPYIFIPKRDPKDLQRVFGLNGKNYIVQTGKQVQVPPAIEEIYRNSLTAEEEQYAYEEQVQN